MRFSPAVLVSSAACALIAIAGAAPSPSAAGPRFSITYATDKSAAPLDGDGVLLRIAGPSAEAVGAALRQNLAIVPALLGDDPWGHRY